MDLVFRLLQVSLLFLVAVVCAAPAAAEDKPKECIYLVDGSKLVRLALPVVTYTAPALEPLVRDDPKLFAHQPCGNQWNKEKVVEAERPVIVDRTNVTLMTVDGDVCAASPRFVIYDANRLSSLYPALAATGEPSPHPMLRRVAAAALVTGRPCGRIPAEFRFTARLTAEPRPTTYSSRVDTKNGYAIILDDPAQEERYQLENKRYLDARTQAKAQADFRWALGALFTILHIATADMPK